jgi:hypothetical protein
MGLYRAELGLSPHDEFAVSFTPANISSLAAWYKADAGLYQERTGASATTLAVAGDDPVGTWLDQSGNARHLKATSDGVRPLLKLAIQNGRQIVRFDGTDDHLKADAFTLNQPEHFFIVGKPTNGSVWWDGNVNGSMRGWFLNGVDRLLLYAGSNGPEIASWVNGAWSIISGQYNGANSYIRRNAAASITGNPGAVNGGGFVLCATPGGTAPTACDVAEVIIYSSAISVAEETRVRNYLNKRWAIY